MPKRFLEHILLVIKNAGIIGSRRGRVGGYQLIKDPATHHPRRRCCGWSTARSRPCPACRAAPIAAATTARTRRPAPIRRAFGDVFAAYLLLIESMTLDDLIRVGGDLPEPVLREAIST